MAFTTEFVMGAGGGVEMFEPTFTPNTTNAALTLASQTVGEGQWLVAASIRRHGYFQPYVYINGTLTVGASGGDAQVSAVVIASGPGTMEVKGSYVSGGEVYVIRID